MQINLKNIKGNQLINILDNIFQNTHINGVISCKNAISNISSKIFIKDGHVAYAVSTMYQAKFGDIMVKKGIISNSELLDALRVQKEDKEKKLIGNILVEMGVITEKVIPDLLYNQIEVVIYEILSWNDLDIDFQETDVEKHPEYNSPVSDYEEKFSYGELMKLFDSKAFLSILKSNVIELINIRKNIPNPYAIPKRIIKSLPNDLTFEQRKILRGVDGINSINDIIILSDLNYFETYKTLNFLYNEQIILIPSIQQNDSDKSYSQDSLKDDNKAFKALEEEHNLLKKKVSDYERFFQLIGKETLFLLKQFPESKKESLNSILRSLIEISKN
jgi:hypothetical protein